MSGSSHRPALHTVALLTCLLAASLVCAAQNQPSQTVTVAPDSSLYVKLQLDRSVKVSALKPGEVIEGTLSQDVYSGDRRLFPVGSPIRLTVGELERRRRVPNDRWPWVIKVFTPRHENYPSFHSASLSLVSGAEIPLRVSLISIGPRVEVHPKPGKPAAGQSAVQAETAGLEPPHAQPGKKATGPIVTLEAAGLTARELAAATSDTAVSSSALPPGPVTLATGTQAKIILLSSISAGKSRAGDSFQARLVEPVRLGSSVVLPEGSVFEGKVVRSTQPRWLSRAGSLHLAFTALTLPGGGGAPLAASVTGAEVDQGSHATMDAEGGLRGGRPGKAWMLANIGVTAGIGKVADDGAQLLIEALVSTATDASTAGAARIVSASASGLFMITRRGRDVILPRFTEMEITFDRPVVVPGPGAGPQ